MNAALIQLAKDLQEAVVDGGFERLRAAAHMVALLRRPAGDEADLHKLGERVWACVDADAETVDHECLAAVLPALAAFLARARG